MFTNAQCTKQDNEVQLMYMEFLSKQKRTRENRLFLNHGVTVQCQARIFSCVVVKQTFFIVK